MKSILRKILTLAAGHCALLVIGCQSKQPAVTSISVAPNEYQMAFDAALKESSARGFDATLRDRRRGIIETDAVISPSIFEPWKADAATFDQAVENTASMQRRRIIWEFTPRTLPSETDAPAPAPDVLAMRDQIIDITTTADPVDLRVSVVIERASAPGTRPTTWTTRQSSRATVIDPATGEALDRIYWTPVARDPILESALLTAVKNRLGESAETE